MKLETINPVIHQTPSTPDHSTPVDYLKIGGSTASIGGIQIWYKNDPHAAGSSSFESREEALRVASFITKCLKLAKVKSPNDFMQWVDEDQRAEKSPRYFTAGPNDFMQWVDEDLLRILTVDLRKKHIAEYNAMFNRVFGENKYEVCPSDQSFTDLEIMSKCGTVIQKWESEFLLTSDEGKDGFTEYRFSYHCYDSTTGVTDWCDDSKVFDNEIDAIRHIINHIVNEKISQHEQD